MKTILTVLAALLTVGMSATAHAQSEMRVPNHKTSVKGVIENCSAMRDYCSGFTTGAYMLARSSGVLGVCWPDEQTRTVGTIDRMVADWMQDRVDKGRLRLDDNGEMALTDAMRNVFPCKEGTQ